MRALHRSPWFVTLLCVLLIGARISGAHWHLCFDQSEPPLAMHIGDIGLHDRDIHSHDDIRAQHDNNVSADIPHQDIDIKLVDDGLLKNIIADLDAPLLFALALCLWLLPLRARNSFNNYYRLPAYCSDPLARHAPPRAPPL